MMGTAPIAAPAALAYAPCGGKFRCRFEGTRPSMHLTRASFGRVTLLLLAIGFAALLGLGTGLVWLVSEVRTYTERVNSAQAARLSASQVLSLIQDAETGQRGYLLTGEEGYLRPYHEALAALPREMAALERRVVRDGGIPGPPRELQELVDRKLGELRRTVELAAAGNREEAVAILRTGRGNDLMQQLRDILAGIDARTGRRFQDRSEALTAAERYLLIGAALALALLAVVAAGSTALALGYARSLEAAQAEVVGANAGLEERVTERTAELAAANEEIQRFAYIVSHDLRAPLVNVMGFTTELESAVEALREMLHAVEEKAPELVTPAAREATEADIPEAIGFIRSSTERMDRLINAILRLSREGRRTLAPERLAMGELVEGLAASLRHQLAEAGGEILVEGRLPDIVADRVAVEQILGNLIDNAVKYLDPARPGRITLRGRARGRQAVFEVEDNGRGIDPRDHARVFELFRRSGAQDRPGEGIGLAHVRALARRLGGNVDIESSLGRGSTFRLTLPLVGRATPTTPLAETTA
jgi:signal transduction histidine kinase